MNKIDWDALRKAAEANVIQKNTNKVNEEQLHPGDYEIEVNGIPVTVEVSRNNEPKDIYAKRKLLLSYLNYFKSLEYVTEDVQKLYRSICGYLYPEYQHLYDSYKEDIRELDSCFAAKAYKATLIMAGSILEAFLLDWLSEIDGVNYFENPYKVRVDDEDGNTYWVKKDQLNEYINQINVIKQPDWMEPCEKAHFIRKNRNFVHAKVCLRQEIGIDEDTCKKVIGYLKEIIDTRLENRREEIS